MRAFAATKLRNEMDYAKKMVTFIDEMVADNDADGALLLFDLQQTLERATTRLERHRSFLSRVQSAWRGDTQALLHGRPTESEIVQTRMKSDLARSLEVAFRHRWAVGHGPEQSASAADVARSDSPALVSAEIAKATLRFDSVYLHKIVDVLDPGPGRALPRSTPEDAVRVVAYTWAKAAAELIDGTSVPRNRIDLHAAEEVTADKNNKRQPADVRALTAAPAQPVLRRGSSVSVAPKAEAAQGAGTASSLPRGVSLLSPDTQVRPARRAS